MSETSAPCVTAPTCACICHAFPKAIKHAAPCCTPTTPAVRAGDQEKKHG